MDLANALSVINHGLTMADKLKGLPKLPYIMSAYTKGTDYVILNFTKDVAIYRNGHGIITCSLDILVINPANMKIISRSLNIEDACSTTKFPKLAEMKKCKCKDRFTDYGFWYKSTDDFISDVNEFYWDDNDEEKENPILKNNPQIMRYQFRVNQSKIVKNGIYNLTYAFSIPGLYPIADYRYDATKSCAIKEYMQTCFTVRHHIKHLEYTVSFDDGSPANVSFKDFPSGEISRLGNNNHSKTVPLSPVMVNNIFYTKYKFVVNYPKFRSTIGIRWQLR